jgi:hypothetical protein
VVINTRAGVFLVVSLAFGFAAVLVVRLVVGRLGHIEWFHACSAIVGAAAIIAGLVFWKHRLGSDGASFTVRCR